MKIEGTFFLFNSQSAIMKPINPFRIVISPSNTTAA